MKYNAQTAQKHYIFDGKYNDLQFLDIKAQVVNMSQYKNWKEGKFQDKL